MRALVFHFSSLAGLLVFLKQLWSSADIEQTVFMAFAVGLIMYTVLMIGFAVGRRILDATPPADRLVEAASSPGAQEAGVGEMSTLNPAESPS